MGEEPEEEREGDAEDEAGDDGEIERGVLAAMNNVAGKLAETEGEFSAEIEKSADDGEESSEKEKHTAEFAERVHRASIEKYYRRLWRECALKERRSAGRARVLRYARTACCG